jgi:hypothetical protein
MPTHQNAALTVAPNYAESAQPVFKDPADLEKFWQEFHSKVKVKLEHWDEARAKSEEDARHLWLRRQPISD